MNREVHVRICGGRPVRFRPPTRRVHAARTDALTLYTVSAQRGIEAMTEGGVLPALSRDAVLVHDFWAPYWHFDVTHAVCGAHLGRELVAAAEVEGQADWASGLDRLLIEINRTVASARDTGADELAAELLATYRRRYASTLTPAGRPTPSTVPASGASADDPSTSTCSTGSTAIATRCCATPRTCGSHSPTTAPSATSAR